MIDVYFVEPSREEIAADRRAALWGRFERASKANFIPPELRTAATVTTENPAPKKPIVRTRYAKNKWASSMLGVAKCAWYEEAKKSSIDCPPVFGHSPATKRLKGMMPGEVLYFKTLSREKSHQLRNAIIRHSRRDDMKGFKFAFSKSQEFVRVECLEKNAFPEAGI